MSCLLYSPIREQTSTAVIWGCYYTTLRKPTPLSPNGTLLPPLIRIKTVPVFDNTTAGSIFIRIKRDRVAVERGEGVGMEARVYRVYLFLPSLFSLSSAFQNVLSVSNVLESVVFSTYLCISLQELIN